MKKKNKSGFLLAETIIVSMVVITALIIIYIQFINITKNYQNSMKYNNVDKLHNVNQIVKFVESEDTESLVTLLNNSENRYVDLTSCDNFTEYLYCENLFDILNIKTVLLTDENTSTLVNNIKGKNLVGEGMYNFLRRISSDGTNSERIVVEFNDETFATLKLNVAYQEALLNGADPELSKNLIPVVISSNGEVKKADITSEWYKYEDKKWANAVVVNNDKQEYYNISNPNTIIDANDIAAYYVWIPRYRYKLFNAEGTSGKSVSSIDIVFENKMTAKSTGKTNGSYLTHSAFTFGEKDVNGFWVGKFEMTGSSTNPTILPNNDSMNGNASTLFITSLKYTNSYSLIINSHLIKNNEWGAIAYLTNSIYGRCTAGTCEEVRINNYLNSNKTLTGCGASSDNEASSTTCSIAYGSSSEYPQSTTKNISGIFDMSGGTWEYVMGIFTDSEGKTLSGRHNVWNSGFNGNFGCPSCVETDGSGSTLLSRGDSTITELTTGTNFPSSKYYKAYTSNATTLNLGEAIWETRSWNGDLNNFVYSAGPWFIRGGRNNSGTVGGIFCYNSGNGAADSGISSRIVLIND